MATKKVDSVQAVELKRRELVKGYEKEEKVPVNISPLYKPYFGNSMPVSVNGISVYIPCDGKTYKVPKTLAAEALGKIIKTDAIIEKKNRMKNVSGNFESRPGELSFF